MQLTNNPQAPNPKSPFWFLLTVTFFSIAMGFLESAVVVYLRKIYYPDGFLLPLVTIDKNILLTEILREAATIVMLITIGIIGGKSKPSRFAYFIFCFGVWDIFYYVFLKALLNWPATLMDWDILFLIPVPWFGPVIVPCIISTTMIALALYIIVSEAKGKIISIGKMVWLLLIVGSLLFIWSCVNQYIYYMQIATGIAKNKTELKIILQNFIPTNFDWTTFLTGELVLLIAIVLLIIKNLKSKNISQ